MVNERRVATYGMRKEFMNFLMSSGRIGSRGTVDVRNIASRTCTMTCTPFEPKLPGKKFSVAGWNNPISTHKTAVDKSLMKEGTGPMSLAKARRCSSTVTPLSW